MLVTDWLETGQDNGTKVERNEFSNGDMQLLLITKVTVDGQRTSRKEKITEEQYKSFLANSICHVEKMRYEFKHTRGDIDVDLKYDEFVNSTLRVLEVDASTETERAFYT